MEERVCVRACISEWNGVRVPILMYVREQFKLVSLRKLIHVNQGFGIQPVMASQIKGMSEHIRKEKKKKGKKSKKNSDASLMLHPSLVRPSLGSGAFILLKGRQDEEACL